MPGLTREQKATRKALHLADGDRIVCAFAEKANGPGWRNAPLWIVVQHTPTAKVRLEVLQPDEQGEAIAALYEISNVIHGSMTAEIRRAAWWPD